MPARTFVIGDIHGCATEIDRLLEVIAPTASDTLVFLGDYIDRGPAAKPVVDRLIQLRREGPTCVFLRGNHEDMFLAFLGQPGAYGDAFLFNGGGATLRSYGLQGEFGQITGAQLPPDHLEFFLSLQLQHVHGRFLCVHAGVAPTRPLAEQRAEDVLWIRDEFISSPHPFPFTVLFGHTPQREVLLHLPYKIGLDTGLVYWNKLSCLEIEAQRLLQIRRGDTQVHSRSLQEDFARSHHDRTARHDGATQERRRQSAP
ncbi:MAG TPA: metallophosphoesterase family protein [Candidatus Acidoferrales bacterium]|nr:metallophosphoesterase family protein [Candidatus Acidoferrales bacterium]